MKAGTSHYIVRVRDRKTQAILGYGKHSCVQDDQGRERVVGSNANEPTPIPTLRYARKVASDLGLYGGWIGCAIEIWRKSSEQVL